MLRRRLKNPIFLIYLLVTYVAVQFGWWIYLIFSLYNQIYIDPEILEQKTWMLMGEGSVFFAILIVGVLVILRVFRQERELTKQQENFVLSVTHELKTPISSVKLYLQTLKKRDLEPEKKTDIYDRSLVEINRLDGLVNDLLMTRSIENDNYFLNRSTVQLDEFIREKITNLQSSILDSHHVELNLNAVKFDIDEAGFESILVNLFENAAKYSPRGSHIKIDLFEKEQQIHLTIQDEGIGISKEVRERVFSKFYREENEMTRKSKGTGLGLFITRFLVEQHHGKITLKENKPQGLIAALQFKRK